MSIVHKELLNMASFSLEHIMTYDEFQISLKDCGCNNFHGNISTPCLYHTRPQRLIGRELVAVLHGHGFKFTIWRLCF